MLVTTRALAPRSGLTSSWLTGPVDLGARLARLGRRLGARPCWCRLVGAAVAGGSRASAVRVVAGAAGPASRLSRRRRRGRRRAAGFAAGAGGAALAAWALGAGGGGAAGRRRWPGAVRGRRCPAVRRAGSPRRTPTRPCRPSSCRSGTARTARPRATRSARRPPWGRWSGTGRARRIRLFRRVDDDGAIRAPA